jgi:hypothetical protein
VARTQADFTSTWASAGALAARAAAATAVASVQKTFISVLRVAAAAWIAVARDHNT